MNNRPIDKLARLVIFLIFAAVAVFAVKSVSSVLMYILGAAVVALVGRPLKDLICRIHIGKRSVPGWLSATLTIIIILGVFLGIIMLVVPIFSHIALDISKANMDKGPISITRPLNNLNDYLRDSFTFIGPDFRIQDFIVNKLSSLLNVSMVSGLISGLASFLASFGVAIFSVVFISFFFLKDSTLFPNIVSAFVPDRLEDKTRESMTEINSLISRYFSGIVVEVLGVALLNFLGLSLVGQMGIRYSIGIAFMTGLLNIIPYVGPLIGYVLGISMSIIIKYACAGNFGPDVSVGFFILIILACLFATQLVDNFFFQPFIYSSSIKAHPLEIFIVLLLAGHFSGVLGMFLAIPAYTVLRVVAAHFFTGFKPIRKLIGN